MSGRKESPCVSCKRVNDPRNCKNKECALWRAWFIEKWNEMRRGKKNDMPKV